MKRFIVFVSMFCFSMFLLAQDEVEPVDQNLELSELEVTKVSNFNLSAVFLKERGEKLRAQQMLIEQALKAVQEDFTKLQIEYTAYAEELVVSRKLDPEKYTINSEGTKLIVKEDSP